MNAYYLVSSLIQKVYASNVISLGALLVFLGTLKLVSNVLHLKLIYSKENASVRMVLTQMVNALQLLQLLLTILLVIKNFQVAAIAQQTTANA